MPFIKKLTTGLAIFYCAIPLFGMEKAPLPDITNVSQPIIAQTQRIIERQKRESSQLPIVSITGCSAVGKTAFTLALRYAFKKAGIRAALLEQDHFLNPLEVTKNYPIHPHLDHESLRKVLQQMTSGMKLIKKQRFDWNKNIMIYEDFDLHNTDIVLFEGTYALSGKDGYNFLDYNKLGIFIKASEENIVQWNWQRETSKLAPRDRAKFDQDIAWDMNDYRKHILPSKAHAHFVIKKNQEHQYSLTKTRKY